MKAIRLTAALLLAVFLLCGCVTKPSSSTDYSAVILQVRNFITERMPQDQVTGMAIALVEGSKVVWSEGFGYADKENNISAKPDTIFEIGSVSKTLATMAVLRLLDAGKLGLDDPLAKYIPGFGINQRFPDSEPITIRSVLTHHSGLPTDIFIGSFTVGQPNNGFTDWLVGYLVQEYTSNPVGYSFAYSNTAFAMLHKVIENASGNTLAQVTGEMFDLMGMSDTTFGLKALPAEKTSKAYFLGKPVVTTYTNIYTAGSVRSTVLDMAKYISVLLAGGGDVLKAGTVKEMFTVQNTGSQVDDNARHGLCFFLSDSELDYAGKLAWHNGATVDQTAHMELLLDQGLGVIVLTNSATGSGLAGEAARMALKLALEVKKGIKPLVPSPMPDSKEALPPAGLIDSLTGFYVGESLPVTVVSDGGGIKLIKADTEMKLIYLENNRWKNEENTHQFEFRKVGQDVILFVWGTPDDNERYGKLFLPAALSAAWQARLGDWEIVNMPADDSSNFVPEALALVKKKVTLGLWNGALIMDGALRTEMLIDPQTDTLAFTAGIGRNRGESVQILIEGGEEILLQSGCMYRKVKN
ncbi:MAG: serine hydrolase domain-containing protein [bacterium]